MGSTLTGTAALVTGASSGIGAATARQLAEHGASVALVARRRDRLEALAAEIDQAGGTALVVEADITDRTQAEAAVQQTVQRCGGLDTLVNNAGLMLLGPDMGFERSAPQLQSARAQCRDDATVHEQVAARDEGRLRSEEEGSGGRNLVGSADPAGRGRFDHRSIRGAAL